MNKSKIAGWVITAAAVIASQFIPAEEGNKLKSYPDGAGVWTICEGVTHGIGPGMVMTEEECSDLNKSAREEYQAAVVDALRVEVTPQILAAHTSFAYNVGKGGYRKSMTLRETNKGNFAAGCRAMMNYHSSGGKDCRVRGGGCYGLYGRRQREINLCLSGVAP